MHLLDIVLYLSAWGWGCGWGCKRKGKEGGGKWVDTRTAFILQGICMRECVRAHLYMHRCTSCSVSRVCLHGGKYTHMHACIDRHAVYAYLYRWICSCLSSGKKAGTACLRLCASDRICTSMSTCIICMHVHMHHSIHVRVRASGRVIRGETRTRKRRVRRYVYA